MSWTPRVSDSKLRRVLSVFQVRCGGGGGWQSSGLGFRIEDSGCSGLQLAFENHKIGMCFSGFLDPQKPPQNINASKPKALEPKLRPKPHAFSSRRPVTAHIMAFSSETRNHTLKQEPPI